MSLTSAPQACCIRARSFFPFRSINDAKFTRLSLQSGFIMAFSEISSLLRTTFTSCCRE